LAPIPAACGSSFAAVAARAGDIGELGAHSAKAPTIISSLLWRLKERNTFALTTVNPAALISKLMMERGARPSFWRIGLRFTSTLSLAIVD
jgi:hypothetical protein